MIEELGERIRSIQTSMVDSARPAFSEAELESLRVLIRLTVEFWDYLHHGNPGLRYIMERADPSLGSLIKQRPRGLDHTTRAAMESAENIYSSESTLSAFDFFRSMVHAYGALNGAERSSIQWSVISESSIRQHFEQLYSKFEEESDFVRKCRHLLDLFKMQIVFAGIVYDY